MVVTAFPVGARVARFEPGVDTNAHILTPHIDVVDEPLRPALRRLRFSGKNMSPLPCWLAGAQSVALNMSPIKGVAVDLAVQLHFALFDGTGGYILKPAGMLQSMGTPDAFFPLPRKNLDCKTLDVISLHNVPKVHGRPRAASLNHQLFRSRKQHRCGAWPVLRAHRLDALARAADSLRSISLHCSAVNSDRIFLENAMRATSICRISAAPACRPRQKSPAL